MGRRNNGRTFPRLARQRLASLHEPFEPYDLPDNLEVSSLAPHVLGQADCGVTHVLPAWHTPRGAYTVDVIGSVLLDCICKDGRSLTCCRQQPHIVDRLNLDLCRANATQARHDVGESLDRMRFVRRKCSCPNSATGGPTIC